MLEERHNFGKIGKEDGQRVGRKGKGETNKSTAGAKLNSNHFY